MKLTILFLLILVCVISCSDDSIEYDEKEEELNNKNFRERIENKKVEHEKFLVNLKEAESDFEKWKLVEEHFEGSYKPEDYKGSSIDYQVRNAFLTNPANDYILENFPGVTKYINMNLKDLVRLASRLDLKERVFYGGTDGTICFETQSEKTYGEYSRAWLLYLTGVEFKNKAAFDAWLEKNRDNIQWNQETGKFQITVKKDE
jgi:hypothetical protein